MNTRSLLSFGLWLLVSTSMACRHPIKVSTYIVHRNLSATLGVGSKGTLEWVVEDGSVSPFEVYFVGPSPCEHDENNLLGSPKNRAHCKIKSNFDGVFNYVIVPVKSELDKEKLKSTGLPPPVQLFAHVDGCPYPCPTSQIVALPGAGGNPNLIYIQCQGGTATVPDGLTVYPGQVIEWSQVGLASSVKWGVSGLDAVCGEGGAIGTMYAKPDGSYISTCTVKAPPGLITYAVKLASCSDGTGTFTVKPLPQ